MFSGWLLLSFFSSSSQDRRVGHPRLCKWIRGIEIELNMNSWKNKKRNKMRIFRQIPRFGYSLMDVGTGSIIFSSGLVRNTNSSSDPTLQAFEFKNTTLFQGLQAETVWRRPTGLGLCRFTFFNTISILFFRFVFQLIFWRYFHDPTRAQVSAGWWSFGTSLSWMCRVQQIAICERLSTWPVYDSFF